MRRGSHNRRKSGRPPLVDAWSYDMAHTALDVFLANKIRVEVILPSQLPRTDPGELLNEHERKFLRTMLIETFRDLTDPPRLWGREERQWMMVTARAWFEFPDDSVISLRMVCDALGLEVSKMQQTAREIVARYEQDKRKSASAQCEAHV
jgi:hypothetical protein